MNEIVFAGKHFLTFSVGLHKHSNWELIYCTEKSGTLVFADRELPYAVGDIVIIPPQTPHRNVSRDGFTNIHLNISEATLPFAHPLVVHDDANQSILHLFSDVYYLFCSDTQQRRELLSAYGNLIVHFMISNQTFQPMNPIAEQIEQSIVRNYADVNYELDTFLSSLPYCSDYLCRIFRREKGVTPHKFLTNLRLQIAANLLSAARGNGSVTEIAQLCGFRNPLYFSRLFKKRYGVSPKAYEGHSGRGLTMETDSDSQKIILD